MKTAAEQPEHRQRRACPERRAYVAAVFGCITSARAMNTGKKEYKAEKQRDRGITGVHRSSRHAVRGSDKLLPME